MKKKPLSGRGSLTIFAALTFMLVAQLLFVLAEGCRQYEMAKVARMNTGSIAESLMAEYCRPMWDDYHLLANDVGGAEGSVDEDYMTGDLRSLSQADFEVKSGKLGMSQYNLIRPVMTGVDFDSYTLLTDNKGKAYVKLVSAYMQNNLVYESAQKIYNNFEAMEDLESKGNYDDSMISDAVDRMDGHGPASTPNPKEEGEAEVAISPEDMEKGKASKQMIEDVKEIQRKDILTLVLGPDKSPSDNSLELGKVVSHRALAHGKNPESESVSWYDSVLLQQYVLTYLSCYTGKSKECKDKDSDSGLSYELEYLVGNKGNDRDNLKAVVTELLAIREAANMVSLAKDPARKEQARVMAGTIAAAIANPELTPVIEVGVLAAWAFTESVLDLRALLSGKKIALLKSSENWTSNLMEMVPLLTSQAQAKECPGGQDYRGYLGMLLLGIGQEKMAMRAMDMQEATIRHINGYGNFCMDHCVSSISFRASYAYRPIFYSFVTLIQAEQGEIPLENKGAYSYLKNKNGE